MDEARASKVREIKGYLKSENGLVKGRHEPIVSEELWAQANTKRTVSPSYQGERQAVRKRFHHENCAARSATSRFALDLMSIKKVKYTPIICAAVKLMAKNARGSRLASMNLTLIAW